MGYANIYVTAPSPENLTTLFKFIFTGLDGLGYQEHIDYDLVESTNPAWGKAVVRVNVYRAHRQVGWVEMGSGGWLQMGGWVVSVSAIGWLGGCVGRKVQPAARVRVLCSGGPSLVCAHGCSGLFMLELLQ
jgi:hypothetical protein